MSAITLQHIPFAQCCWAIGTVPAVVIGGMGTLLVAALWMRLFPALRGIETLTR